jgi:hypothetical protein
MAHTFAATNIQAVAAAANVLLEAQYLEAKHPDKHRLAGTLAVPDRTASACNAL